MKKLLLIFLVPLSSYSQIIIHTEITPNKSDEDDYKMVIEEVNITEFQDEYVQVMLLTKEDNLFSSAEHILKTTNKDIPLSASLSEKKWNVYDGDILISLSGKIDVINYFNKYGFEYLESDTKYTAAGTALFIGQFNIASESSMIFKNNNN